MRTHLFRGVVAVAVLCAVSVAPALAQSVVRGKVIDAQGKPVPDATILFEATDANRKTQTKTDKNGDFLQVGLASGGYKVTASKDKVGTQTLKLNVRQGPNNPLSFTLSTSSGDQLRRQGSGRGGAGAGRGGHRSDEGRTPRRGDRQVQRSDRQDADLRGLLLQHRRGPRRPSSSTRRPRPRSRRRSS